MANVTFHVGSTAPPADGLTTGGLYINQDSGGIWYATSEDSRTEVGSWVTYTKTVTSTSGTKLGTITINGTPTDIYQDDSKGCSYNTSSKIFLIGAKSQSATSSTGVQTYSHDTAYVGTDGCLYSNSSKCITVATETKNTAGGTSTAEKLYFVGMKSDGQASAQTYTNSFCFAEGQYLYSDGLKCANLCSTTVSINVPLSGNDGLPIAKGDSANYYITVSGADIGGSFVGYDIGSFISGYNGGSWAKTRLGVQVGTTSTGGTASYKLGVKLTANATLTHNQTAVLDSGSVDLIVYYIPY